MNLRYETVIIGGGPAGLTAAYYLAKAGRQACVLEQKKEIGKPVCCGEAISAKSLENSGLFDDSYIDSRVRGFRIFFPNSRFFSVESPGYLIHRDKFEQFIAAQAEKHGAKILPAVKAVSMGAGSGAVWVNTTADNINADFIIGADGPDSAVERAFFSNNFYSLDAMQYKISKNNFPYSCSGWLDFYYDPLSPYYFWVFEKKDGFNAGGLVNDKNTLQEFIKKRFPLAKTENAPFSRGKIPMSWMKKSTHKSRAFLAGDAAGLTNPVTFAGIYSAIASGKTAAESIISYGYSRKWKEIDAYANKIKQAIYSDKSIRGIARHCYKFPLKVLDFIGEYFDNGDFRTKDCLKFIKLSLKTPEIFGSILPLLAHRQLLKNHRNDIW